MTDLGAVITLLVVGMVWGYMLHIWKTWGDEASSDLSRKDTP